MPTMTMRRDALPKGITLGEFLRRVRMNRRLTQQDVIYFSATRLGEPLSSSRLSKVETGERLQVHGSFPAQVAQIYYPEKPEWQRSFLDIFETLLGHRPQYLLDDQARTLVWAEWTGQPYE